MERGKVSLFNMQLEVDRAGPARHVQVERGGADCSGAGCLKRQFLETNVVICRQPGLYYG